jgi:CheY-like chemotaxis protein
VRVDVIDGDEVFARTLARALEARGMVPRVLLDGRTAVEEVDRDRPDLIVLCAELPDVSGYAVCSRIKRSRTTASIPVIITSAAAETGVFEAHQKLWVRAAAYLRKPFDGAALLDEVEAIVELPPEEAPPPMLARSTPRPSPSPSPGPSGPGDEDGDPAPRPPDPGAEPEILEDGFDYVGGGPEPLDPDLVRMVGRESSGEEYEVMVTGFLYLGGAAEAAALDEDKVAIVPGPGPLRAAARTSPGRWALPAELGRAAP